jgi:hypothetical protein
MPEVFSSIELFGVCLVAALYLTVDLWTTRKDVAVRNAEIRKMPSELWSERRVIVGLYFRTFLRKSMAVLVLLWS